MQDPRVLTYMERHELNTLFPELEGALLRYQPSDPYEFVVGCVRSVQQKKRESRDPLLYSVKYLFYFLVYVKKTLTFFVYAKVELPFLCTVFIPPTWKQFPVLSYAAKPHNTDPAFYCFLYVLNCIH